MLRHSDSLDEREPTRQTITYDEPISILCDNTSAINISKHPVMHSKKKNILIKYHFLWEHVTTKKIKLECIGKKEKIENIFTKTLSREAFEYLRQKMGVLPSSH